MIVRLPLGAVVALVFICSYAALSEAKEAAEGRPALSGGPCLTKPLKGWTKQEKWVWSKICVGEVADFNKADGYGGELDPKSPEGWPDNRVLRPKFLETILLYEPWRSAIPRQGMSVVGAWVKERFDLSGAIFSSPLLLEQCRFDSFVNMENVRTSRLISISGSRLYSKLNMNSLRMAESFFAEGVELSEADFRSAKIEGQLVMDQAKGRRLDLDGIQVGDSFFMREGGEFNAVILSSAEIKGQFVLESSTVTCLLDMNGSQVEKNAFLDRSKLAKTNLRGARINGDLSMIGSKFTDNLDMNGLYVGGSLLMREGSEFLEVDLTSARIENSVGMDEAKFTGLLNMNSLQVGGSLFLRNCSCLAEVRLRGAKIGSQLSMRKASITGKLDLGSLQVETLLMNEGKFTEADFRGAEIKNQLSMDEACFKGQLMMDNLRVGGTLLMRKIEVQSPIWLTSAKIDSSLDFSGSSLRLVSLSGTTIQGELRLVQGHYRTKWQPGAELVLRNTRVGVLQDGPETWPEKIDLEGFTYEGMGGFTASDATDPSSRPTAEFIKWLEKQPRYSPQPYEQLASVLEKMGEKDKAKEIRYAGKVREHRERTELSARMGLYLSWAFIGYGYYLWRALIWTGIFVFLGMIFLRCSGQELRHRMRYCGLAYSLDMFLPIIELRKRHEMIDLDGWVRVYFYVHRILGYVVTFFLIAGLSGLTK